MTAKLWGHMGSYKLNISEPHWIQFSLSRPSKKIRAFRGQYLNAMYIDCHLAAKVAEFSLFGQLKGSYAFERLLNGCYEYSGTYKHDSISTSLRQDL